jgi:hypothetical protein
MAVCTMLASSSLFSAFSSASNKACSNPFILCNALVRKRAYEAESKSARRWGYGKVEKEGGRERQSGRLRCWQAGQVGGGEERDMQSRNSNLLEDRYAHTGATILADSMRLVCGYFNAPSPCDLAKIILLVMTHDGITVCFPRDFGNTPCRSLPQRGRTRRTCIDSNTQRCHTCMPSKRPVCASTVVRGQSWVGKQAGEGGLESVTDGGTREGVGSGVGARHRRGGQGRAGSTKAKKIVL